MLFGNRPSSVTQVPPTAAGVVNLNLIDASVVIKLPMMVFKGWVVAPPN